MSKKVSGNEPPIDFDGRDVTPIEYIPYKRFNDHLEAQEKRAKRITLLVSIVAVAMVVTAACALVSIAYLLN